MSRVLLLNPPGTKNYIRDYFCSKLSKAFYQSPPVTLLMLSGMLAERHRVGVLDAIAEGWDPEETLRRILDWKPDAVVSLVGEVSWDEDRAFLARLKAALPAYLIAVGDCLLEETEARLEEAAVLDAALHNFVTPDILELLPDPPGTPIANVVYRQTSGSGPWIRGERAQPKGEYHLPCPRHELFPLRRYRFPFSVAAPMSVVLTDYGCPFACTFCVIPSLGFRVRPLEDVLEELAHLHSLGVREIFFIDQTFGAGRERALKLCQAMAERKFKFHWSCFSRTDVTSAELLGAMARAGCHTIIYGVESANQSTLDRYGKRLDWREMEPVFRLCRAAGIRVAATFMFGLPGEGEAEARVTLEASLRLPIDFAAFNLAVPRAQTELRRGALAAGRIPQNALSMDQSGRTGAVSLAGLSSEKLLSLRREATRRFYLRPAYLIRRLLGLRSWRDFQTQLIDGWSLFWQALTGRGGR